MPGPTAECPLCKSQQSHGHFEDSTWQAEREAAQDAMDAARRRLVEANQHLAFLRGHPKGYLVPDE